jgi:hypothetical protein
VSFVAFRRRAVCACAAALAATAAFSGSAIAADEPPTAGCPAVPTVQPFGPWQDFADYFLAPDGGLENGAAGWDLGTGAAVVDGNEPFQVAGAGDTKSLSLAPDGSATTAAVCVGVEHRTMRFFARARGAGVLHVDAVYAKRTDKEKSVRLASIAATSTWAPTPIVPMVVNEIAADYANALPVSLRFTVRGEGSWQIDDVFVDPYRRG